MGKKWGVGSHEKMPVWRMRNFPHPEPRQWLPICGLESIACRSKEEEMLMAFYAVLLWR